MLHIPNRLFWSLTPREYYTLLERYREQRRRQEWYTASVTAILATVHRDRKIRDKPFTAEEFMQGEPQGAGAGGESDRGWTLEEILKPTKTAAGIRGHLQAIQIMYGKQEAAAVTSIGKVIVASERVDTGGVSRYK